MGEAEKIERLKRECYEVYKFRKVYNKYNIEVSKIMSRVDNLKLNHLIDPMELAFIFHVKIGNKITSISIEEFKNVIDDFFKFTVTTFYFHIPELRGFPNNYRLGHGYLLSFDSLPQPIKTLARDLAEGKTNLYDDLFVEKSLKDYAIKNIVIPKNPEMGFWLKITTSSISYGIRHNKAFEFAEESLDILRIINLIAKINSPELALRIDERENKSFPVTVPIRFGKYEYEPSNDKLINRLSDICVKTSSDLEYRIKNALHFFRIGENHAPDYQKIFYYVAGIEQLILGDQDRDVLRWKFSEKGAILMGDDVENRIAASTILKTLYDLRSAIAHGGKTEYNFHNTSNARHCLIGIIMKILELIDRHDIKTVSSQKGKKGNSLDEYIEKILFSG